jgi:hypothetical protein
VDRAVQKAERRTISEDLKAGRIVGLKL